MLNPYFAGRYMEQRQAEMLAEAEQERLIRNARIANLKRTDLGYSANPVRAFMVSWSERLLRLLAPRYERQRACEQTASCQP